MYFIDTHCHIDSEKLSENLPNILADCQTQQVQKIIVPNIDEDSYVAMMQLCQQHTGVLYPSIGIHPTDVKKDYQKQLDFVSRQLNEQHVGIGEVGLDFYWSEELKQEQIASFEAHMDIAIAHDLPVMVHSRDAYPEIVPLIQQYAKKGLRGVLHCFGSGVEDAKKLLDAGFYLGIGGVVTFKNTNLREVIKEVGMERLVLETDAPYLAPVPHRGKLNSPAYIPLIAQTVADVFAVSIEQVAEQTTRNAEAIFTKVV